MDSDKNYRKSKEKHLPSGKYQGRKTARNTSNFQSLQINIAFQFIFLSRIPKPPQNAVINQIRAVPEVSSKQASAEKISHEFIKKVPSRI